LLGAELPPTPVSLCTALPSGLHPHDSGVLERDEFEAADAWERSMGKLNSGDGKRQ
jgi:hypothetical protein